MYNDLDKLRGTEINKPMHQEMKPIEREGAVSGLGPINETLADTINNLVGIATQLGSVEAKLGIGRIEPPSKEYEHATKELGAFLNGDYMQEGSVLGRTTTLKHITGHILHILIRVNNGI